MTVVYYSFCFLIMCYYHSFLMPFIFTIVFLWIRSYIGGWHASTMQRCQLVGLLLFTAIVNILLYPDVPEQGKVIFSGFSVLFIAWAVHRFGIQDHTNRPLSEEERAAAKKKFFVLLTGLGVVMLLAALLQQYTLMFSMALGCFAATVLLLLAKFQKKGRDRI